MASTRLQSLTTVAPLKNGNCTRIEGEVTVSCSLISKALVLTESGPELAQLFRIVAYVAYWPRDSRLTTESCDFSILHP